MGRTTGNIVRPQPAYWYHAAAPNPTSADAMTNEAPSCALCGAAKPLFGGHFTARARGWAMDLGRPGAGPTSPGQGKPRKAEPGPWNFDPAGAAPMHIDRPRLGWIALALLISVGAAAQSPLQGLDLKVHPEDIDPAVTIKQFDNRTVEEYSVNNNTYMIKVTPAAGAPYFLVDTDGSGDMDWRRNSPGFETQPPEWSLLSW
jgi:hypothetical protein